ncbi:hypothetical protein KJ590_04840 [Patescibacteria group bacterium]|nr:hypothetical protein [Patescibacteria group bacterium]
MGAIGREFSVVMRFSFQKGRGKPLSGIRRGGCEYRERCGGMFRNPAAGVETSRRFALMGMEEVGAPLGADGPAKAGVMICAACRADDHQGGGGNQSA